MKEIKINDIKSIAHTQWNCKYHVVFAPKLNVGLPTIYVVTYV